MSLYADAVLADTPLEYWAMGEAAPDGTGTDLTLSGVTAVSAGEGPLVSGDVGATSFDGVNDSGQVALDLSGTEILTIEFWLRWDAFANDDDLAMEFTPNFNVAQGGFLIDPNSETGKFAVGIDDTGSKRTTAEYTRPSAAAWHHYAIRMDNRDQSPIVRIETFIDGELAAATFSHEATILTGPFADSTLFLMCRNAAALFGAGDMAHLAVYDSLLSEERIAAHFSAASAEEETEEEEEPEEPEEETDPEAFDDARLGWVEEDGFHINKGALTS